MKNRKKWLKKSIEKSENIKMRKNDNSKKRKKYSFAARCTNSVFVLIVCVFFYFRINFVAKNYTGLAIYCHENFNRTMQIFITAMFVKKSRNV